eukprot:10612757-Alexandrium_andersonii.AAC.1
MCIRDSSNATSGEPTEVLGGSQHEDARVVVQHFDEQHDRIGVGRVVPLDALEERLAEARAGLADTFLVEPAGFVAKGEVAR